MRVSWVARPPRWHSCYKSYHVTFVTSRHAATICTNDGMAPGTRGHLKCHVNVSTHLSPAFLACVATSLCQTTMMRVFFSLQYFPCACESHVFSVFSREKHH